MSTFRFQAKAEDGRLIRGELEAGSESEARIRLRAQKMVPIKLESSNSTAGSFDLKKISLLSGSDRVSAKDLQVFTRQFAVLISAGVPIVQSLDAMSKGSRSPAMGRVLLRVTSEVERGKRLGDALGSEPSVFDRLYVNLVRAGEESGALEAILVRLAEYIEKSVKLRAKIVSALWYPAIVILVAVGVVAIILMFVVPRIAALFSRSGQQLPALTRYVVAASGLLQHYWYLGLAIAVGIPMLLKMYYETPDGRKLMDAILIDVPVFGTLVQRAGIARFSRTLATLLSSGVRIVDALEIAASTTGNSVLEKGFLDAKASLSRGRTLAEPIAEMPHVPRMVSQMISIGEQTGNMDAMLNKVADFYEDEVENATEAMTSMIEPLLIVFLGGIVGTIVIAMYLPIFKMASTM